MEEYRVCIVVTFNVRRPKTMPTPSEKEPTPPPQSDRKDRTFELNIPDSEAASGAAKPAFPTAKKVTPPLTADSTKEEETPTAEHPMPDVEVEVQAPQAMGSAGAGNLAPEKQGWITRMLGNRTNRRDVQIQALQTGYIEMVELMRSIRNHLDHQVETQRQLADSLQDLPQAVSSLGDIGKMTEHQTEVLGMVRDQLGRNEDHEKAIMTSMDGFNTTLGQMDQTSRDTTQTVAGLVEQAHASEASLRAMMERSEKRMATLTGFMSFLAIGAVGFALYVVLARTSGDGSAEESTYVDTQLGTAMPTLEATTSGGDEETVAVAAAEATDPAPDSEAADEVNPGSLTYIAPWELTADEPATDESFTDPFDDPAVEPIADENAAAIDPFAEPVEETVTDVEDAEASAETTEEPGTPESAVAEETTGDESEPASLEQPMTETESDTETLDAESTEEVETQEPAEAVEEDVAERPGVEGVVRRVFSFLESDAEEVAEDENAPTAELALDESVPIQP